MWVLKEIGILILILGFMVFALTSRLLPMAPADQWLPQTGDIALWLAGFCAYAAGALSMSADFDRKRRTNE